MRRRITLIALITGAFMFSNTGAQTANMGSPIGLWKTIDDQTGQPRGIVRVYETDGRYFARIEKVLVPGDEANKCTACSDDRKDQPLIGLVFMRNIQLENGEYSGGDILDPKTGSIYRCHLKLEDEGKVLMVRGYLGVSLFGRTQKWLREPG